MNRTPVQSSMITSIGYDPRLAVLEIQFQSGGTYQYFDVPEFLYRGFLLAHSKGEYFSRRIDNRFRFEKIN